MTEIYFISYLALFFGIGYLCTALYLLSHPHPSKSEPRTLPEVSVLIAMRNEEDSIADCLYSLEVQNYPSHLYDVYIIDDGSTDRSVEIVKPFLERNVNFHLFSIKEEFHGLKGKMNALAQTLEKIESELILITDGDCIVPPSWVRTHVSYFDESVGMVGGLTMLEPAKKIPAKTEGSTLFGKIQALDWLFLQTIAAATSNAKKPVSILGNNFGFRLKSYKEIGGFKTLGFSVTEDFVLMRAIENTGKWQIRHTLDPANTIYSHPLKNFKEFFQQRKRWIVGGKSARPWGYFIIALSFFAHISILLSFLFLQWNVMAGAGLGMIIGIDYFFIIRELKKLNLNSLKRYFLHFELFHILYMLLFSVLFLFPQKVVWKERKFE